MADDRPAWVGQRAVAWVIDDAPVPPELAFTLTVIARRCDEHGRGSYQSMKTLGEKTGKSPDQAARDVKRLRELGLIVLGDQSLPERHGVPAGQRPTVYDLPLHLKGPKPVKASRNPSGRKKEEVTPRMDATPGTDAPPAREQDPPHGCTPTPGMHAGGTPCMDARATPRMDATQTTLRNNTGNKTSINHRARVAETRAVLEEFSERGLTDFVVGCVIDEAVRRADAAGRPLRVPVDRYIATWQRPDVTAAVGAAYDAEDAARRPARPELDRAAESAAPHDRTVAEATKAPELNVSVSTRNVRDDVISSTPENVTHMDTRRPCPHGEPGGAQRRADGQITCRPCRLHAARTRPCPPGCDVCAALATTNPTDPRANTA